jgi:hypothetical protein
MMLAIMEIKKKFHAADRDNSGTISVDGIFLLFQVNGGERDIYRI